MKRSSPLILVALFVLEVLSQGALANGLLGAVSPHLLQHASNPVPWRNWSGDSFSDREDQLVFLSVGYSSCHWCHVMNREVFSQAAVAEALASDYLPIKIDRDEFPEVDGALQRMAVKSGHSGGWPLNIIMTSSGTPLHFMNYVPSDTLVTSLSRYSDTLKQSPLLIEAQASLMTSVFESSIEKTADGTALTSGYIASQFDALTEGLLIDWDKEYGGLAGVNKAPREMLITSLMHAYRRQPDADIESAVRLQLDNMRLGGLFDPANGGVFRYSAANDWAAPHFEKMLYNQALMLQVLAEASSTFGDEKYLDVALELLAFLETHFRVGIAYGTSIDSESGSVDGGWYTLNLSNTSEQELGWLRKNAELTQLTPDRWYPYFPEDVGEEKREKLKEILAKENSALGRPMLDSRAMLGWNAMVARGINSILMNHGLTASNRLRLTARNQELLTFLTKGPKNSAGDYPRYIFQDRGYLSATARDLAVLANAQFEFALVSGKHEWNGEARKVVQYLVETLDEPALSKVVPGSRSAFIEDGELSSAASEIVRARGHLRRQLGSGGDIPSTVFTSQELKVSDVSPDQGSASLLQALMYVEEGDGFPKQPLQRGIGVVELTHGRYQKSDSITVDIELLDGWKLSAPVQPANAVIRPFAARLSDENNQSGKAVVSVPQNSVVHGPFGAALSGKQALEIAVPADFRDKPLMLSLDVQVCSTELCLLPETLFFGIPK